MTGRPQNAIATALAATRSFLTERADTALSVDPPVRARLASGLRLTVGDEEHGSFTTDMPTRIGGSGAGPSPGHFLRGAVAACMATAIAMRAADCTIQIEALTVTAGSRSDSLAFFGLTDGEVQYADVEIAVEISAPNASSAELDELIEYAKAHAPVGLSMEHIVPTTVTWSRTGTATAADHQGAVTMNSTPTTPTSQERET